MKKKPENDLEQLLQDDIPDEVMEKLRTAFKSPRPSLSEACPNPERVIAYALGEAASEEENQMHTHILECRGCLDLVLDVRAAWAEAQETMVEAPEVLPSSVNIWARFARFWEKLGEAFSSFVSFPKLVPVMVAASVLVAALAIGLYQQATAPIGVKLDLIARSPEGLLIRGPSGEKKVLVPRGGVLHSGDRFQIAFETNKDAYIYVFFQDNVGKITTLFSGRVLGDKRHKLPGEHDWFRLDETKGREEIHVMAAKHPIANLDEVIQQLNREGISSLQKAYPQGYFQSFSFKHE